MRVTAVKTGRLLLKTLLLFLVALLLGLLGVTVTKTIGTPQFFVVYILAPGFIPLGGYLLIVIYRTFTTLTINDEGIILSTLMGRRVFSWNQVAKIRYWVELQAFGGEVAGTAKEPFAVLEGPDGKKLLLLKSTYDSIMFDHLLALARAKNILITGKK